MVEKQPATPARAKKASLIESAPSVDAQIESFESYFGAFGTFFGADESLVEVSDYSVKNPKYPNSIVISGRYANGERAEYAMYYLEALDIKNSTDTEKQYYLEGEIFIDKVYYYLEGSRTFAENTDGAEAYDLELRAYPVESDKANYVQMSISEREIDGQLVKSYDYKIFKGGSQQKESISYMPSLGGDKAFDLILNYGGDDSRFTVYRPTDGEPIMTVGYEIGTKRSSFKVSQTKDKAVWIITDNYICTLDESAKTCTITGYKAGVTLGDTLLVPDDINGYKVTEIGYQAFQSRTELKKVVIPASVKKIDTRAFAYCRNIEEIEFNEGLTEIGYDAFSGCMALKNLAIPASVNVIYSGSFYHCCNLESITVAEGNKVFKGKGNCLIRMVDTYGNGTIYGELYLGCVNSVIPQDLNINYINNNAFYDTKIKNVTLPSTLTYMGASVFESCSELEEIVIPEKLTRIERRTFTNCTKLNKITIPDKEIGIAEYAFNNTAYANNYDNWDMENGYRALYIGRHLISLVSTDEGIYPDVVIKSGTLTIAQECFQYNLYNFAFASITLNRELVLIDEITHMGGAGCGRIEFADGYNQSLNGRYIAVNNCLIDTVSRTIIAGCDGSIIPSDGSVDSIGAYAFAGCVFDRFVIPDNIRMVREYAFAYCRSMRKIEIAAGVTFLGDFAFEGCRALEKVTFIEPEEGDLIYDLDIGMCFLNCDSLVSIELPARAIYLRTVFMSCNNLTDVKVNYGNENMQIYILAEYCDGLKTVTFSGTSEEWKTAYRNDIELMPFSVYCEGDGVTLNPDYHE